MNTPIDITRVSLSLPCKVPVVPGTPNVDAPLEERTEQCHVDAWWIVGIVPTCDVHLRVVAEVAEFDFDELVEEGGGLFDAEKKPWSERHRYPQE